MISWTSEQLEDSMASEAPPEVIWMGVMLEAVITPSPKVRHLPPQQWSCEDAHSDAPMDSRVIRRIYDDHQRNSEQF